jgi:predicted signal transduction protein with EAL and GGDEF domain
MGHLITTDASIGIALAPVDGVDLDQLLKNADLALYGAKGDGRRTYRFFEAGMDQRAKARRSLELELRQAISDGSLETHYQPVVNIEDGKISSCEALLRWRHPERGMISPAEFIPIAEDSGLINQLGLWVLNTACAEAVTWPDHVRVAVNVSPVQFRSPSLALNVAAALAACGLRANRLELEITEAVLIRDDEAALDMLHQLRKLGVRIALDDFGTGYSSLSYLQRFPFDKIKIDRSFIRDIAGPGASSSIVQAVVNIAAASDMTTTAEGVETEQQRNLLYILGCTEMQGYLFSPAITAAEVRRLLLSHRGRAMSAA